MIESPADTDLGVPGFSKMSPGTFMLKLKKTQSKRDCPNEQDTKQQTCLPQYPGYSG